MESHSLKLRHTMEVLTDCFQHMDCSNTEKIPRAGCTTCMEELRYHAEPGLKDLLDGVDSLAELREEARKICLLSAWRWVLQQIVCVLNVTSSGCTQPILASLTRATPTATPLVVISDVGSKFWVALGCSKGFFSSLF